MQARELFVADAKSLVESDRLFQTTSLHHALVIHPVKYPKYMYRLHSFFKELEYNATVARVKSLARLIKETYPFIPSHLCVGPRHAKTHPRYQLH